MFICYFGLAFTNSMTKDRIAEAAKIEEDNAKKEVLSLAETFEELKMLRQ